MNFISFLYISIYDWFYRNGRPRHPNSYDNSQERAAYILTVGIAIWALLLSVIYRYEVLGIIGSNRTLVIPIAAILSYYLLYFAYIKNKKFENIYERYKERFGPNNIKYQLIAWSIVLWLPFSAIMLLALLWHHVI